MDSVFPVVGWSQAVVPTHWNSGERGGSDLFAPFGTPVVAVRGGTVIYSGNDRIGGINVSIQDNQGLTYYYAHLDDRSTSTALVSTGQVVQTGQQLGGVGDSGNARGVGPHLHIGIGFGISLGEGPQGGCGLNFDAVGLLQQVLDGGGLPGRYRVAKTDGSGLNLRREPSTGAAVVRLLAEGAMVERQDRAWRPVRDPAGGATGWAAEQFLIPA
jgi:murein DD-endopeptidase MepM/ murein hydrolase activator NlpD